ncbi:hypothetical protein STCU_11064 [Strigomonas culicis]|uniref:Uncharacterized protein n=1 Tax=Strigomonas culicis TaxID=28005 RepID=S9UPX8_9TRYP|nr:hypothetical protein STCU_11064 [Strigomonas culicis]|eukprot:EPY16676.1 hypothetical protein STCU_11064 [Strigomonas culicis]
MLLNILIICLQDSISRWELQQRLAASPCARSVYALRSYLWACESPLSALVPCRWTYSGAQWAHTCVALAAPAHALHTPHLYLESVPEGGTRRCHGHVACVDVAASWHDVWVLLMLLRTYPSRCRMPFSRL